MTPHQPGPPVLLENAMGPARSASPWPLFLELPPGVHAIVGSPSDGTTAIAHMLAGIVPLASGRVLVQGSAPHGDPRVRARVGALLDAPDLPPFGKVRDLFGRAGAVPRADGVLLDRLGLVTLSDRHVTALSRDEARAVELALALGLADAAVIVLTEPLADVTPLLDRAALRRIIADKGATGDTVVIVATASTSDAVELASTVHLFQRGRVIRSVNADDVGALAPGRSVELRLSVDLPRLLLGALCDEPMVIGVRWDGEQDRSLLVVRGEDLARLALAVNDAALRAGVQIRSIEPVIAGLDEALAASAGLAMAAYHAAYRAGTPGVR